MTLEYMVNDQAIDYDLELHFSHAVDVYDTPTSPDAAPVELNSDTVIDYFTDLFETAERDYPDSIGRCYIMRFDRHRLDHLPKAVGDTLREEMSRRQVSELAVLVVERAHS